MREIVQAERERLIAESVAEAERARAGLEVEKAELEAAIEELRGEWVGFISDALVRLEAFEPETASASEENGHVTPMTQEASRPEETTSEPSQEDVVTDLRDRLPSSGDAWPTRAAELQQPGSDSPERPPSSPLPTPWRRPE